MTGSDSTLAEIWKAIPGFTGYDASTFGQIRSYWDRYGAGLMMEWEPHVLKPKVDKRGRLTVKPRDDSGKIRTRPVHQLILETFVGPCPTGMIGCHFPERDPSNCRLENLRWDTHRENTQDAVRHGTRDLLNDEQIAEMVQLDIDGMPRKEIAARFKVRPSCVSKAMARAGRPRLRRDFVGDADLARMLAMRQSGMTYEAIAHLLSRAQGTVYNAVNGKLKRLSSSEPACS